jgi:DNA-binding transcriptional ArsR family regulator
LTFILVSIKLCFVLDAAVLAAVASPRRREILRLVWHRERAAGEIHAALPDVSFGAISLQLKSLREAGLVSCRRQHRQRFYIARRAALGPIAAALETMWDDALWRLKLQAELEHTRRGPKASRRRRRKLP